MTETPPGGLTPPGPPSGGPEPDEPRTGGMSVDDWINQHGQRPAATPRSPAPNPYAPNPAASHGFYATGPDEYGSPVGLREFDRASLVGFALSLTGVVSVAGVILGLLGLRRTADDTKAGRWAAILAIAIGTVATLGVAVGVAGSVWFRDNIKTTERAETGACVDVDDSDGVLFFPRSCTEPHRAEIVAAGDLGGRTGFAFTTTRLAEFCSEMADEKYRKAARTGDYAVTLVISSEDPRDPEPDDSFACYYSRLDGRPLDDRIPTGGGA